MNKHDSKIELEEKARNARPERLRRRCQSNLQRPGRAFQVSSAIQKREARCKQRIRRRLRRRNWPAQMDPMFGGRNIHYEGSDRVRGLGAGGIGAMQLLAERTGLTAAINQNLR